MTTAFTSTSHQQTAAALPHRQHPLQPAHPRQVPLRPTRLRPRPARAIVVEMVACQPVLRPGSASALASQPSSPLLAPGWLSGTARRQRATWIKPRQQRLESTNMQQSGRLPGMDMADIRRRPTSCLDGVVTRWPLLRWIEKYEIGNCPVVTYTRAYA